MLERVMSSWWWHRLFLTLLPLTRETINNYSRSRHHGGNHSTRGRLKTKTDCTRKVREVAMHWPHCPFPRRAAPHGELSPDHPVLPVGRENPGRTTSPFFQACGSLCWSPYSDLPPCGLQRNLQSSTTGNLWYRRGEGLATTSMDLGRPSSYLQFWKKGNR